MITKLGKKKNKKINEKYKTNINKFRIIKKKKKAIYKKEKITYNSKR